MSKSRIPTFTERDGRITAWLNLKLAELASEVSRSPYSDAESEALKVVEAIAERDDFKFSFRQAPGDLVIVNNFSIMHKRSAFKDDPDSSKRRLMLRLWLNLHCAQLPVPEVAMLRTGFRHAAPVIAAAEA